MPRLCVSSVSSEESVDDAKGYIVMISAEAVSNTMSRGSTNMTPGIIGTGSVGPDTNWHDSHVLHTNSFNIPMT